jgi:hypothetical protein
MLSHLFIYFSTLNYSLLQNGVGIVTIISSLLHGRLLVILILCISLQYCTRERERGASDLSWQSWDTGHIRLLSSPSILPSSNWSCNPPLICNQGHTLISRKKKRHTLTSTDSDCSSYPMYTCTCMCFDCHDLMHRQAPFRQYPS